MTQEMLFIRSFSFSSEDCCIVCIRFSLKLFIYLGLYQDFIVGDGLELFGVYVNYSFGMKAF